MCMNDFDFQDSSAAKMEYFKKPASFFLRDVERAFMKLFEYHNYFFIENKDKVYERLLEVRDQIVESGSSLKVVLVPIFPKEPFSRYPLETMHREISAELRENGIFVLDLLAAFKEQDRLPRDYALDDWHLNQVGHQFVAQQMIQALSRPPADLP
jgi:hypothetical protein